MHKIVLINTWMVVQKTRLIFIYVDEVTIVDFQSWLGFHVYFVVCWKRNLVLLTLEHLINDGNIDYFTKVIMDNVLQYGGLL